MFETITHEDRLAELRLRIDSGEPGLMAEYEELLKGDPDAPDPILERLRVKRSYTLSPLALVQRQNAAEKSTGPVTPEGKAASSMNAWKHGQHSRKRILSLGKPCKSTCPQYPCSLVNDGDTQPGQQCLDKQYMLQTIEALSQALTNGNLTDLKQVITLQLGGTLQVIEELQASIIEYGVYMKSEKLGKDGKIIGHEIKPNPSLLPLSNLLKAAGVTLPDFMITPAAVERKKSDEDNTNTLANIFSAAADGLARAKAKKESK
jgi:hypothetical protein